MPVRCTRSSAESNILMPRMSYSRLLPGAERLGHRRDPDAQPAAPGGRLLLLLEEVLVADRLQADVQALPVLPGVEQEAERGAVRELVVADQVDAAELGLVHAEVAAAAWIIRSWKNIASVTRNEHR